MASYSVLSKSGRVSAVILMGVFTALSDSDNLTLEQWRIAGQNLSNSRSQPEEHEISPANVHSLTTKWVFTTGGDVSATPAVAGDAVYAPDWAGNLFAIRKDNGKLIWSRKISDYDGMSGAMSRVTPAVVGDALIIGDNVNPSLAHKGANVIAVNRHTGDLRWITQVDRHPAAIITGSPVFLGDVVYVGVSSNEEGLATNPNYPCCSFRGSVVALNVKTGAILWKTFDMPDNGGRADGYSGGAIWQPPAIDPVRHSLYVGTGNNYTAPKSVEECQNDAAASGDTKTVCTAPDDYFDTALAMDLETGHIKWAKRLQGFDTWTVACIRNPNPVSCPVPASPDYDLGGSGPNLLDKIVGFGQKSGIYWR